MGGMNTIHRALQTLELSSLNFCFREGPAIQPWLWLFSPQSYKAGWRNRQL